MQASIQRVNKAINELKKGNMIILVDHPDREDEGDIIVAAEKISHETMNFMIQHCSGIVCLTVTEQLADQLALPLMVDDRHNMCTRGTAFTVTIDASKGITTGVSAADRVQTVLTAINDETKPYDLVRPGHVFPLIAKKGGVLERNGHTEGSIDLMKIAGLKEAAVLCEVMNKDGTMTRGQQLDALASEHDLVKLAIEDIVLYRLINESIAQDQATTTIPTEEYGQLEVTVLKDKLHGKEHLVIHKPQRHDDQPTRVRIHSSCITGDLFTSLRCDCNKQLQYALHTISEYGGYIIYLNQEGRDIGLLNKIKSYALQQQGMDTVEANEQLGFEADMRDYIIAANILHQLQLDSIELLTNNPDKISQLQNYGVTNMTRQSMPVFNNTHNQHYLETKHLKLNHFINLENLKSA